MDQSQATLKPRRSSGGAAPRLHALTVLHHPDLERVGEVAPLLELEVGARVAVGRAQPLFGPPGEAPRRGLDDRHVSRRPAWIARDGKGLVISAEEAGMEVALDGVALTGRRTLAPEEVERGAVLELAGRVALLLHRIPEPAAERPPRLGLVGASEALDELLRDILRVADLPVPVLIRGETGSGKELVARAVHRASARADRPFVAINMAAIPGSTAASELFGHGRGAFTGAVGAHGGYFEQAAGGTLFLDEIGATPADVQPLLLRALDSGEVQPLGASAPRRVDVRLIAATDALLEEEVAAEAFRAPLLHRLEGAQLFVPPLRARRDDIGRLVAHFLRLELEATGERQWLEPSDGEPWLPASLAAELARLDWPGNVRQLRSLVRQLAISSRGAARARVDAAVTRLLEMAGAGRVSAPPAAPPPPSPARRDPEAIADAAILEAMRDCDFAVTEAAARLGVSRSYLYGRVKAVEGIRRAADVGADEILAQKRACGGDLAAMARHLGVSRRALRMRMSELKI